MSLEREAFEKEFKAKWGIGHHILGMVRFIEESQDYAPIKAVKQMSDEYYWVLALNTGWWAWQTATKREGFKFVPVEPSVETMQAMNREFIKSEFEKPKYRMQQVYKAMIEVV